MLRLASLPPRIGRTSRLALGAGVATLALTATLTLRPTPKAPAGPPLIVAELGPVLLDPRPSLAGARIEPVPAGLQRSAALPATRPATRLAAGRDPATTGSLPSPSLPVAAAAPPGPVLASIPLPVPRPAEFRDVAQGPVATPTGPRVPPRSRRVKAAAAAPAVAPEPNFFERLFGVTPEPTYAALDTGPVATAPAPRIAPVPAFEGGVAVYDIGARTVTLPNGERLEAHSGLGDKLDDPRHVHVRMRGATPPGTYDLTEREALFHGVRAIRLNPVGGSGAVFGRSGLLAHTYMLGPNGDSNGCMSVRDYDRFLQAFLRGEVRRLVVVAGRGWDAAPGGARVGRAGAADPSRG